MTMAGSPSQLTRGPTCKPSWRSTPLSTPFFVAKMKVKIMPLMEVAMTVGMKYTARNTDAPRSFWLSSTAISSAMGMMNTSLYSAYSKVVTTLFQKVVSFSMRVMLAMPV